MKLKNIFIALLAILPLAFSCVQDELGTLSNVQVSTSMVCLPLEGGSSDLILNTTGEWAMNIKWPIIKQKVNGEDVEVEDKWFTFTPEVMSGAEAAKDLKITFSAEAITSYRGLDIEFNCAGQTQLVRICQGEDVPVPVTIAELLAEKIVGKVYKLSDVTVDEITNFKYGGMNISDATGKTFVYGTLDKAGNGGNFASLGINAGDKITIKAKWTSHGNLDKSVVLEHKKSLLTIDKTSVTVNHDGLEEYKESEEATEVLTRNISLAVTVKGETIACEMPEWISIKNVAPGENGASIYTFNIDSFDKVGETRDGAIVFKSTAAEAESVISVKVKQIGLPSLIKDVTVEEFLAEEESEIDEFRVSGVIVNVKSTEYGNITIKDQTGELYIHGVTESKVLKNDKSFSKLGLKLGDYITVIGKRTSFKGSPQMGSAYYESSIKVVPASVADFLNGKVNDKSKRYALTGKVTKIKMEKDAPSPYGNFTLVDGDASVYVYGLVYAPAYYLKDGKLKFKNNKVFNEMGIKEGDQITVCGFLGEFNGDKQLIEAYLMPAAPENK